MKPLIKAMAVFAIIGTCMAAEKPKVKDSKITLTTNCKEYGVEQAPGNPAVQSVFEDLCKETQFALFKGKFDDRLTWRVTEQNPVFWRFSWKLKAKHEFNKPFDLTIQIKFLDRNGFALQRASIGPYSVDQKETVMESDSIMVAAQKAHKIGSIETRRAWLSQGEELFTERIVTHMDIVARPEG